MLMSSMDSCSRSQNPARSWAVGRGLASGFCGADGGQWGSKEESILSPPSHIWASGHGTGCDSEKGQARICE